MNRKLFITVIVACIALVLFSCKKKSTSNLMVYWKATTTNGEVAVGQELQNIYTAFDNEFSHAKFGKVSNHSIRVDGVAEQQIDNIITEIRQLSAKADESLNTFNPSICYTITVTVSTDNNREIIANYNYCPKEPADGDNNGGDNNGGDNNGGDNGPDGNPNQGDGIVDPGSVYALKPVFYAPLTSNLQDFVSGEAGAAYGTVGNFTERGLTFNYNRIVWESGWWNKITYNTPFTILADYKRTGNNSEHMNLINSSPGPGVNVERGFHICCRSNNQNDLTTAVYNVWVDYGVASQNTALVNAQHFLTGFSYDGNGTFTRIQDGVLTSETWSISQNNFPDFEGTPLCIGGLNNYYKDFWVGTIANVMIFNTALTQTQITSLH